MLRLERLFNVLVQLLVGAGRLCRIQVATANDVTIGSAKVQCVGHALQRD